MPTGVYPRKPNPVTEEMREQVKVMRAQGVPVLRIAVAFGISPQRVYQILEDKEKTA